MNQGRFSLLIFILLTIISNPSWSKVTISNIYSGQFSTVEATDTKITLYTGMTDQSKSGCSSTGTCDTCSLINGVIEGGSLVCGDHEILPGNYLQFTITTDDSTSLTGTPNLQLIDSTKSNASVTLSSTIPTFQKSTEFTVYATWANICSAAGATSSSDCDTSFDHSFKIGFSNDDSVTLTEYATVEIKYRYIPQANAGYQTFGCSSVKNYEGYCYFKVFPGDNKVYVDATFNSANTGSTVPGLDQYALSSTSLTGDKSNIKFKSLRVYDVEAANVSQIQSNFSSSFTLGANHTDLDHSATSLGLAQKSIKGFSNNHYYLFVTANVDQAGLVSLFSQPSALCTGLYGKSNEYKTKDTQCAMPQKVYGMLDGQNCFIATASYGSIMAPEVETFRKFRNQFLLKSALGKFFVRKYYKYSPVLADFIATNENLKFFSRVLLLPFLLFANLSLHLGFLGAFFLMFLLAGGFLILIDRLLGQTRLNIKLWK